MKCLVGYRINEHSTKMSGVFNKFIGQVTAMSDCGIETYGMFMSFSDFTIVKCEDQKLNPVLIHPQVAIEGERETFWKLAKQYINNVNPDVIYIRYDQMYDGDALALFFSAAQSLKIITILEFPTYPYENEIEDKQALSRDLENRKKLLPYCDYISSTCKDEEILGIRNLFFNNKISRHIVNEGQIHQDRSHDSITAVAVANVSAWHGFDRLIRGMFRYKANNTNLAVDLMIIGEGAVVKELKKLVSELHLDNHVRFMGYKNRDQLRSLYSDCDIGIDTLAPHRKDLSLVSSLKAREYVLNGLPILTTECDEELASFAYSYVVKSDESPIELKRLVDWVLSLGKRSQYSREIVEYGLKNLCWESWAETLNRKISQCIEEKQAEPMKGYLN